MKLRNILVMAGILVVLAGVYFISRERHEPEPSAEPRQFIWSFAMNDLKRIAISLPAEGKREAWIKHEDRHWYFDQPNGSMVNAKRWGGGIPLLLSGPGAQRLITSESSDEQLAVYGFKNPRMKMTLTLENKSVFNIEIGDKTLDGQAYYIKKVDSRAVYTVDYTWYDVLARLVLDPPYPKAGK